MVAKKDYRISLITKTIPENKYSNPDFFLIIIIIIILIIRIKSRAQKISHDVHKRAQIKKNLSYSLYFFTAVV